MHSYQSSLADEKYFQVVIEKAAKKGLSLVGRVTIDSNSQELNPARPYIRFVRETTILFAWSDKAFLLAATYVEDFTQDTEGESHHPFWQFKLLLGAIPGMWFGYDWLRITQSFCGVEIHTISSHLDQDSRCTCQLAIPHQVEAEPYTYDGVYKILLGFWPIMATPDVFMVAVGNLLSAVERYTRVGKLSAQHSATSFAWTDNFKWDDDFERAFLSQIDPDRLHHLFEDGVWF